MQKINFQDLPSTSTAIDSANLNLLQDNVEDAINEVSSKTSKDYLLLYLNGNVDINAGDTVPFEVMYNTNPQKFNYNESTHILEGLNGNFKVSANIMCTGASSGAVAVNIIALSMYYAGANGNKVANQDLSLSISPIIIQSAGSNVSLRFSGIDSTLRASTYSKGCWMLIEEI